MPDPDASVWLSALRRYLVVSAIGHLAWEGLQLPLYTLWAEGTAEEIAFALFHCTVGDVLIALNTLAIALVVFGDPRWPGARRREIGAATILSGIAYTIFSEWLNMSVRGSWAYAPAMPTLPMLGTGLTPVLQWIVIPSVALITTPRSPQGGSQTPR